MNRRLEVEHTTSDLLAKQIALAVREAVYPLKEQVIELQKQLRHSRAVITHREAPAYFDNEVKPSRILDYIKGRDLPMGTTLPLPANKIGNSYLIEVEVLQRWQVGKTTAGDLYPWQIEKLKAQSIS